MVSFNDIKTRREEILRLADCHGAHNVRIFGSLVRGENTESSDIDLLVTMEPDRSLFDRIELMQDLEDLLHVKVDVVNEKALSPLIRTEVLSEGVTL
jgi:predicted nucleotidyltransferase